MCTQKPPHDYSEALYDRYKQAFSVYIDEKASCCLWRSPLCHSSGAAPARCAHVGGELRRCCPRCGTTATSSCFGSC